MSQLERLIAARDVIKKFFKNWGYVASILKIQEAPWIGTAGTEGLHFFYNEKFIETLTDKQLAFLWAHEIFHVAGNHMKRTPAYVWNLPPVEKKFVLHKWNVARDHAIHQILVPLIEKHPDILEWIPEGMYDEKYANMASEKIYKLLENPPSIKVSVHIMMDAGGTPTLVDGEGNSTELTSEEIEGLEDLGDIGKKVAEKLQGIKDQIEKDKKSAEDEGEDKPDKGSKADKGGKKSGGKKGAKSGSLSYRSRELLRSEQERNWKDDLIDFMVTQSRSDYSYRRIHRGWYHQTGLILPTLRSDLLKGVIAVDVSGSIDAKQYNKFAHEIDGIRGQIPDHELLLIFVSHIITGIQEVKSGEPVDWTVRGSGGTNFRPVFDYLEMKQIDVNFLLFFTDGENSASDRLQEVLPPYEVMWVLWNKPHYSNIPEGLGRKVLMHE